MDNNYKYTKYELRRELLKKIQEEKIRQQALKRVKELEDVIPINNNNKKVKI